ncbi:alpha/beta fold hydrolase [Dactylosporangium sp. CS-033363]|uniref:alpha/beta fold hydrolase n=1 Tax=Dactylosporangium sp. CS-033363 TaxID=3239935 RepID=UPI003D89D668
MPFRERHIDVGDADLLVTFGGAGPPLLLLHGPSDLALALAARVTVVRPQLRGAEFPDRTMARDALDVMGDFGYDRFTAVGHDLGARVALRLALDHPGTVVRLALIGAALPDVRRLTMPHLVADAPPPGLARAILDLMGL